MGKKDGHANDLKFLAKVRNASEIELAGMLANHRHKAAPAWKRVAIERALVRVRLGVVKAEGS